MHKTCYSLKVWGGMNRKDKERRGGGKFGNVERVLTHNYNLCAIGRLGMAIGNRLWHGDVRYLQVGSTAACSYASTYIYTSMLYMISINTKR